MVVVGGRAPQNRWGSGSLQELDQPPIVASITKSARTIPTADEVTGGFDEAFRLAGSPHRGPVFVDVPDGPVLRPGHGPGAARGARARGRPGHRRDRAHLPPAGRGRAPGADPRHRRLGGRRGAGSPRAGRGGRHPHDHQRHGPRHRARRPPAAGHQGARQGSRRCRPGRRGRHATGLPARVRRVRRQGGGQRRRLASSTSPTPPTRSPATRRWPTRSPATSRSVFRELLAGLERADLSSWKAWVEDLQAGVRAGGGTRRRAALRRGRPDPPGPHLRRAASPTGRRRGRDRRRRRLRQLRRASTSSRSGPAAGSTRDPTAASAPVSAPRSPRGSPGPRPRWCCCSATAPRGSR